MEELLRAAYVKCGFCTAKNHCAACGKELSEDLLRRPGIDGASLDLLAHTLRVAYRMDREELEDLLDGMGIMVDPLFGGC